MHGLEAEYWGQVDFLYINRENPSNTELNQLLGVRYQPEFYFIDAEGNMIEQWFGGRSEEQFRALLNGYLAEGG